MSIIDGVRWIAAAVLFGLFAIGAAGNAIIVGAGLATRRRQPSLVPIVGGLAGAVALAIVPIAHVRAYWWIPLFADIGAVPMVAVALVCFVCRRSGRGAGGPKAD